MSWFESRNHKARRRMGEPCPLGGRHDFESFGYGYGYSTYTCRKCDAREIIDLDLGEQR